MLGNDGWDSIAFHNTVLFRIGAWMRAFRFQIPFKNPILLKGRIYADRQGVLLERNGQWAEASPLPGFSLETVDDVVASLRGKLRGKQKPPASLMFALSALNEPFAAPISVPYNFLLLGDSEEIAERTIDCQLSKCKAVKMKVGQDSLESDVKLVKEVRQALPGNIQLRLDANQSWDFEEAVFFIESLGDLDFEYIEEPLRDPLRMEELFHLTGVSYALDESLVQTDCLDPWPNAAALVCKPTLLGGRQAVAKLALSGKPIVFSAAFESGVGIRRIMQLAAEFSPDIPAGLDTLDWLANDVFPESLQKQDGLLTTPRQVDVNTIELEEIVL
ncbi:MAG: o-succinylbenzoate synthase [Mariniblastus sp.]|nr:o-succinylbenzoate synthase [Mariniblastus sp.]